MGFWTLGEVVKQLEKVSAVYELDTLKKYFFSDFDFPSRAKVREATRFMCGLSDIIFYIKHRTTLTWHSDCDATTFVPT